MLTKNLPQTNFYKILFIRLVLDGVAGLHFLSKGKIAHAFAILKAHFSFYQLFSKVYKKRNSVQNKNYFKLRDLNE